MIIIYFRALDSQYVRLGASFDADDDCHDVHHALQCALIAIGQPFGAMNHMGFDMSCTLFNRDIVRDLKQIERLQGIFQRPIFAIVAEKGGKQ